MTPQNKKARRDLHAAINGLSREEVAEIVKQARPRTKGKRINELAKLALAELTA